jgi:hypothetical protein
VTWLAGTAQRAKGVLLGVPLGGREKYLLLQGAPCAWIRRLGMAWIMGLGRLTESLAVGVAVRDWPADS